MYSEDGCSFFETSAFTCHINKVPVAESFSNNYFFSYVDQKIAPYCEDDQLTVHNDPS